MSHKRRTAEMTEARWSVHNSHTSVNVCLHEIKLYLRQHGCLCVCALYFTVYLCMCSLHSTYMYIELYSAKGITNVTLNKKIKFVLFVWYNNTINALLRTHILRGNICCRSSGQKRYFVKCIMYKAYIFLCAFPHDLLNCVTCCFRLLCKLAAIILA